MTITDTIETATWVAVPAVDLLRALKNAKLFAGDNYRPAIAQTEITFTATGIQLVTTDSYALLIEQVACTVPTELVGKVRYATTGDMAPLFAVLKAVGKYGPAYLKVGDGLDAGGHAAVTIEIGDGVTSFTFAQNGTYPNWEQLFDRDKLTTAGMVDSAPIALGVAMLKRIGSIDVGDKTTPAILRNLDAGALKPVAFTIGSNIVVIQMPVRG